MKNKLYLQLVILITFFLTACNSATEAPITPELISIKIGVLPYISYAPLYIAQKEGFFSDQGLEVELIQFNRSGEMIAPLLQGDIDVVIGSVTPSILNAISQGGNIKFTANKGNLNPDLGCSVSAFMARNELLEPGFISDPENLKGLTIANVPGSLFDYALEVYLEQQGLSKGDIEEVSYPASATLMESIGSGAIDIGPLGEPWITRTINTGKAGILIPAEQLLPNFDLGLIIYGKRLLENIEVGQKFMLAYLNSVQFYSEGKTERNIELVAEFTQLSPEEVESGCWQSISLDGQINVELILDFQEWALEKGFIDSIVKPEQFWDPQFIEYANKAMK